MPEKSFNSNHFSDHRTRSSPRLWTGKSFIPFRLEVLTPVFISSGTDLSPLEYVIRKNGQEYFLHLIDINSWLIDAQGKSDVMAALNTGDMLVLRRLIDSQLDTTRYSLGCIAISNQATAEKLLENIRNNKSLSNVEVQPFIKMPNTMATYVPGSSIKGAISTPLIDALDKFQHGILKGKTGYYKGLEGLFGKITEHSMQALKVSDIPVPPEGTRIVNAIEARLVVSKTSTPKPPCETLSLSKDEPLPLYGRLFMETSKEGVRQIKLPDGKVVTLEKLSSLCNSFYTERFNKEYAKFYRLNHLMKVGEALKSLHERINNLDPKREILLRVGHYSHVECITVTNNDLKFRKGYGKTRTLADGKLPFGWVILHFCDEKSYIDGLTKVETAIKNDFNKREKEILSRGTF